MNVNGYNNNLYMHRTVMLKVKCFLDGTVTDVGRTIRRIQDVEKIQDIQDIIFRSILQFPIYQSTVSRIKVGICANCFFFTSQISVTSYLLVQGLNKFNHENALVHKVSNQDWFTVLSPIHHPINQPIQKLLYDLKEKKNSKTS